MYTFRKSLIFKRNFRLENGMFMPETIVLNDVSANLPEKSKSKSISSKMAKVRFA